jgi:hypothetical protein
LFLGFGASSGEPRAVVHRFTGRQVTKILIQPVRPLSQPATVQGYRCSDRKPLRFSIADGDIMRDLFPGGAINESTLETRGDLKVQISTAPGPPSSLPAGHPMNFHFYSTGDWEISVREATQVYTLTISVLND